MSFDLKILPPDPNLPSTGILFGADSQSASSPSVYTINTVKTTLGVSFATPLQYGATGNGIVDDTAFIQATVNASKYIQLPYGYTFRVTSVINVPSDVYISGPGTIFVDQSPYYTMCFNISSGVTFDGVVFRGANNPYEFLKATISSNLYGKAIAGVNVNDITIKNCQFYNFKDFGFNTGSAIICISSSYNLKVLNNYFENSNYGQGDIRIDYRTGNTIFDGNVSYSNCDYFLGIATLTNDISSTIEFPNSANHIITNNIMIKDRWGVPLSPITNASFNATIVSTGVFATMTVSGVTGTIASLQTLYGISGGTIIPPGTIISAPDGGVPNSWKLINPTGFIIPTVSTPTPMTSAVGATFTGTIANKVLTIPAGTITGNIDSSQWIFCASSPLPTGTKVSTSTASFTGSVNGTTLTIATTSVVDGTILADNTETIYGLGIPTGTTIVSQTTPLLAGEALGGPGRYTLSANLGVLTSRDIYVNNRWNVLSDDPNLSVGPVSMTSQQTNLGRHGIVVHYQTGYSYSTITNNFIGNTARHGIYLRGASAAFTPVGPDLVANNYFAYCGSGSYDVGSYSSGIRLESSLPATVTGNYFYKSGFYPDGTPGVQDAQDIENSRGSQDTIIAFNTCIGAKDGAINLDMSVANKTLSNIKVIGNTIQNSMFGISYNSSAVATSLIDDVQIIDNHITLTGADFIFSSAFNAPRSAGIWADVSQLAYRYSLRISGNTVVGTGLEASFTGTIVGQTLTASAITGQIASGQKVTWQTASFNLGSIANNILTIDPTAVLTGSILANGTEVLAGTGITTGTRILKQLTGPAGGIGTYQLSTVLTIPNRAMTVSVVGASIVSPMATFLGSISTAAGGTLTVTEMGSGTIIPGGAVPPTFTGIGVTVAAGTTITAQLTSTEPGGALGGTGTYSVSISQTVDDARMSVTNVWNLSDSYSATAAAMTSNSNAFGVALPFGTDTFAGTALVDDNTFRGLKWGLASWRFAGNIANALPHKKLGFEVVWDRNRFVSCDNAMLVAKNAATDLAMVNPNNVFDGCTNTNISTIVTWETAVRGRSLGQTSGSSFTGEWMASGTPTVAAYIVGDRVLNSAPASGSNIGWICTSSGSPGTWQRFGAIGLLSGSVTYDPPSLADTVGVTTTLTVTGAALGDYVTAVSFSLDLQGIMVTGWVSAADTVSVRFQNETGGTIDLASGTLRATVIKA